MKYRGKKLVRVEGPFWALMPIELLNAEKKSCKFTFMGPTYVESFREIPCIITKIDFGGGGGGLKEFIIGRGCTKKRVH